jgi:hypothetical protein
MRSAMERITWTANIGVSCTRKRNVRSSITARTGRLRRDRGQAARRIAHDGHLAEGVTGLEELHRVIAPAQGDGPRDQPEHLSAGVAFGEDRVARGDLTLFPGVDEDRPDAHNAIVAAGRAPGHPGEEEVAQGSPRVHGWYAIRDSNPEPAD